MTIPRHRIFATLAGDRPRAPALVAIACVRVYRVTLSPVLYAFGLRCRHAPTCSEYAIDAFQRHGAIRGGWLTVSRLSRCHPFGSHGFDPAPATLPDAGWRVWRYGDWAWTPRSAIGDGPDDDPETDAPARNAADGSKT